MGKLFNGILSVSLVLMMLSSCGERNESCGERNEVRRVLSSFMETEIELPADMEVYAEGGFSTAVLDSLSPVKMIIYYDSADCSSCRISHLIELEPLYWAAEEGHYDVVTIFSPRAEEIEEFRLQLSVQDIGSGVCRHVRQFCGRERGDTGR